MSNYTKQILHLRQKKKRQQIKKQILFFFNFLFFSLFELVVYLMDPQLMDETLQTPADVVSGTFLQHATSSSFVCKSTRNVSQTFFFELKSSSGLATFIPWECNSFSWLSRTGRLNQLKLEGAQQSDIQYLTTLASVRDENGTVQIIILENHIVFQLALNKCDRAIMQYLYNHKHSAHTIILHHIIKNISHTKTIITV